MRSEKADEGKRRMMMMQAASAVLPPPRVARTGLLKETSLSRLGGISLDSREVSYSVRHASQDCCCRDCCFPEYTAEPPLHATGARACERQEELAAGLTNEAGMRPALLTVEAYGATEQVDCAFALQELCWNPCLKDTGQRRAPVTSVDQGDGASDGRTGRREACLSWSEQLKG